MRQILVTQLKLIAMVVLIACQTSNHKLTELSEVKNFGVGYADFTGESAEYAGRFWYPTTRENQSEIPTGKFFRSFYGQKNAEVFSKQKKYPLLILSHGSGSSVSRLDWMADYFVQRGWIVVGINHPGNTLEDNSAEGLMEVWKRPKQISHFLDWFLRENQISSYIDRTRIVAAGHSAGGTTVLMLAGARLSKSKLQNPVPYCESKPDAYDDEKCAQLKKIDVEEFDQKEVEADYTDTRIKAVVAMDPGFARSFQKMDPNRVTTPIQLILAEKLKSPSGEIYSHNFPKLLPSASTYVVPNSIHISFITPCNEFGIQHKIPICTGDENRKEIQKQINEKTFFFLTSH